MSMHAARRRTKGTVKEISFEKSTVQKCLQVLWKCGYMYSPCIFPKASLLSAVYFHYTNLSFVGLLGATKKISRQPAGYPWSLKRDFFPVAIIRQNLIANVCSNSEDTSWIMISSYGWLDAKGQQHVPQGGVAGSFFVGSGAPSYLFMARRLIVTQCVSEWKRGPDATF